MTENPGRRPSLFSVCATRQLCLMCLPPSKNTTLLHFHRHECRCFISVDGVPQTLKGYKTTGCRWHIKLIIVIQSIRYWKKETPSCVVVHCPLRFFTDLTSQINLSFKWLCLRPRADTNPVSLFPSCHCGESANDIYRTQLWSTFCSTSMWYCSFALQIRSLYFKNRRADYKMLLFVSWIFPLPPLKCCWSVWVRIQLKSFMMQHYRPSAWLWVLLIYWVFADDTCIHICI